MVDKKESTPHVHVEKKIEQFVKFIDETLEKPQHPLMARYLNGIRKEILRFEDVKRQVHFEDVREENSRPYLGTYLDPIVAPEPEPAEEALS